MTKSLTILFQAMGGISHLNGCIGVAQVLQQSGHRIVFAVSESCRGKLIVYGFEEELMSDPHSHSHSSHSHDNPDHQKAHLRRLDTLIELPLMEKLRVMFDGSFAQVLENAKRTDNVLIETIINKYKPDVVVVDTHFLVCPSLVKSGIPWILLCSSNPLSILNDENVPPSGFGLSIKSNKNEWNDCRVKLEEMSKNVRNNYNEWLREYGLNEIPNSGFVYTSPYLNIYDYPQAIDYTNDVSFPLNFYGFDNFMRTEKTEEFVLPDVLRIKSGKLVYLAMGSHVSGSVKLMKRLVAICSKSPHRFVVSTGQSHDEYELADNMWGQKFLPQTKVLPLVDLFISHGGNNSLTEAFYFGKPMIVLPIFGDQMDNAQRLQDTGYGIRLDAFNCSETELLEAIEKIINDSVLKLKLEKISERIQTSKSLERFVKLVEALVN